MKHPFHNEKQKWLIVDDDTQEAAEIALAAQDSGAETQICHSVRSAVSLLKREKFDLLSLDFHFTNSSKTAEDIVSEVRRAIPSLPIIVVSGRSEEGLIPKLLSLGADGFVPKISNFSSFQATLKVGAELAIAHRRLKLLSQQVPQLGDRFYLSNQTKRAVQISQARVNARLMILGETGTGKTKLARKLAEEFLQNLGRSAEQYLVYIDCEALSQQELHAEFFGEGRSEGEFSLTCFERAISGALILDNLHALSAEVQIRLKHLFTAPLETSSKEKFPQSRLIAKSKIYCTYHSCAPKLVPGFIEALATHETYLPNLKDLLPEAEAVLAALCDKALDSERAREGIHDQRLIELHSTSPKLQMSRSAAVFLLRIIKERDLPENFRSLQRVLRAGAENALADARLRVEPEDLTGMVSKYSLHAVSDKQQSLSNENPWLLPLLQKVSQANDYDGARELLQKALIHSAMVSHDGNKTKVSQSLGLSRQTLYRFLGHEL